MMKGYKVFNPDWTCRKFQYEVGQVYEMDEKPVCCDRGFHFCTKAADCFKYYDFNPDNKVAEVEALGDIDTNNDDSKEVDLRMKIGEIVYYARILPKTGEHELVQLRVRSIRPTYFSCVCTDNSKQSYIFNNEDLEDVVFEDIAKANELLNKRRK